ncbi:MAG: isopenicillin N synthase family oxygenase [Saccharospirillum sp.]|nr:isopenicillin N synthase family oxygenase [Saccharospirillum sp.]
MTQLPIISLAGLLSDDPSHRRATAATLGKACREVGFFYLTDHGMSSTLREAAFAASHRFFDLPLADKQRLSIKQSPHNRGYVAMADERLNPEAGSDLKEAFNLGGDLDASHPDVIANKPFRGVNFWPELEGWRATMLDYFSSCLSIGRALHRGFSLDLGMDETFFEQPLADPVATLRLLHYPASADSSQRPDGGAGTHTDYGNVTLLATDEVAGLEVLTRQGQWLSAPYIPGAFVFNIGDCLMRWSNDTYLSTPHRVRPPEQERYAIAFFLEVNPDTVVDPLDIQPDQEPLYPPIRFADYLTQRLNATYDHRQ